MPTYDYTCDACHRQWEAEQRITEAPIKKCPKCGAMKAKRQISRGAGFILKGGGWYSDLYSSRPPALSEPGEASSSESSSTSNGASTTTKDAKPSTESTATSTDKPATKSPKKATKKKR